MKIIIGASKKNLIKKIKILSSKINYIFYKYHFLKDSKIISFISDRREEIEYNDIILAITSLHQDKQILKLIRRK